MAAMSFWCAADLASLPSVPLPQLSLLVAWDRGTFNGFTWYNAGPCDACGGMGSSKCIQTQYQPEYQQYTQSTCACELVPGWLHAAA